MRGRRGQQGLVKITVPLPLGSWHGHATESIWAEDLGQGRYRVRNVPFYAKGIAAEDVILTKEQDGACVLTQVVLRSGHSTYRVFLADGVAVADERFRQAWRPLEELGCTFERATEHLVAVDVPARANLGHAYQLFEEGERTGVWEFEEGYAAV